MSTWTYRQSDGKAASKIVPPRLRIPCWKSLGADSEEKREPASDIDTGIVVIRQTPVGRSHYWSAPSAASVFYEARAQPRARCRS
jgi:hypothetical protein